MCGELSPWVRKAASFILIMFASLAANVGKAADDEDGLSIEDDANYGLNAAEIKTTKIWGGTPVAAGAFPATVGITRSGTRQILCTGTLIQPDVVLTAAHCVCQGITGSVVFGDREGTGSSIKVAASTQHLRTCGGPLTDGLDLGLLLLARKSNEIPVEIQADEIVQSAKSYRVIGLSALADMVEMTKANSLPARNTRPRCHPPPTIAKDLLPAQRELTLRLSVARQDRK